MKEVCYYVADDGTKFDDRWECLRYEKQKQLEECKDEFILLNYHKEELALEEVEPEDVVYIVIKTDRAAEVVGNWFSNDGCLDPFDGFYKECVGTWIYGEELGKGDEWLKLELEIEKIKTLLEEIHR